MATDAKIGWGGQFFLGTGVLAATQKLAEVKSFTLPTPEVDQVEVTHMDSPNRRREFISGMIEDGEIEVVMNYVPGSATDILIRGALAAGTVRVWKATVPRSTTNWEVSNAVGSGVIVIGYERGEVSVDSAMEATLMLRITGDTVEAAAI